MNKDRARCSITVSISKAFKEEGKRFLGEVKSRNTRELAAR